ncbi:MAG: L-threonylcarbamoyladenylate synthase [Patescibacteria group bacterium]|nr:L-threonylcarbamoyladenylate synthase [Patescibacteria group bacterium]
MAKILNGFSGQNVKKAARLLKRGEVVAFPTETVYGLGANVYDRRAVATIFEVKKRPLFDPLIVHIANLRQLEEVAKINQLFIFKLMAKFWPGPLTLILPKKRKVPYLVTAGLETVAVRMPANLVSLSLIQELGAPIAAPSANLFGKLSPTKAEHVQKQIGKRIKIILDGGKTAYGLESTILFIDRKPKILRLGSLPIEEIKKVIGPVEILKKQKKILAPGNLPTHYSPFKPLKIVKNEEEIFKNKLKKKISFLAFCQVKNKNRFTAFKILSPKGDLKEAASNFFDALHQLDESEAEVIFAEAVPEKGVGRAIMERLKKASSEENKN